MEQQQQQQQQQNASTIEIYPVKEKTETNNEYKVACDVAYRRTNVLRLSAQYLSEREIADRLQISQPTIHRDLTFLRTASLKLKINKRR
jgi:ATP/maltotriose-dependent transcriptional regulator MalT